MQGATLAFGGKVIPRSGYYLEPTIFTNVTDGMKIAREEIFGPVMSIIKYKTFEEAIQRANSTEVCRRPRPASRCARMCLLTPQAFLLLPR